MNKYKVLCKVGEQNDYPLFIKADNEAEAEKLAKGYFILENPDLDFYSVQSVTKL